MRELLRPRFWIALILAMVAGFVVWLMPPQPIGVLELHRSLVELKYGHFQVCGLTANARFVVMRRSLFLQHDEKIAVFDLHADSQAPVLELEVTQQNWVFLSPDEQLLCVVVGSPEGIAELADGRMGPISTPRPIMLYDLPSGRILKEYKSDGHYPFFGPDNKLLVIENGVLRDLDSGAELNRLPEEIDGFKYRHSKNEFAFFVKEEKNIAHMRLHSWLTGEFRSSATFPMVEYVTQAASDGRVLCWVLRTWNNVGMREQYPQRILDTSTGESRDFPVNALPGMPQFSRASPDGDVFVYLAKQPRLPKWLQWLPNRRSEHAMRFVRWRTDEELAMLPGVGSVCFSADGAKLAAVRDDQVVEIYDFPFRKPWALIAGAGLLAGAVPWSVAWAWSRWRRRRGARVTSPGPDTPPH